LIPVLGSAFNRWLLEGLSAPPLLVDWWSLLEATAHQAGLLPDPHLEAVLAAKGDAAFAWEALLKARLDRWETARMTTISDSEEALLRTLSGLLEASEHRFENNPLVQGRWKRFADAVWGSAERRRGDLLSLNFSIPGLALDSRGQRSTAVDTPTDASEEESAELTSRITIPAAASRVDRDLRVWFPHGRRDVPQTMVLGTHRYVRSAAYVVTAFDGYHCHGRERAEARRTRWDARARLKDNVPFRDDDGAQQNWVSVALDAPLLLLGVGLDRTEVDLWEFLHLRARLHANLPESERPPIWRLTSGQERCATRAHWTSLSRGIAIRELNLGPTWADAWETLLAMLPDRTGRFGA
jgi:hypothetical protein